MINGQTAPIVRGGGFLYGPSGVAAPGGLLFLLSVHGICLAVFVTVQEDCAFINDGEFITVCVFVISNLVYSVFYAIIVPFSLFGD